MKYFLGLALAFVAAFSMAAPSGHSESEPLVVGYVDFPPFTYTNDQGRAAGYLNEVTRQVADHLEQPLEFREMPAARLERGLRSGRVDVFQGIRTFADQLEHVSASDQVLLPIDLMVYGRPGDARCQGRDRFAGMRVGVLRGYAYGGLYDRLAEAGDVELMTLNSRSSAYRVLINERVDCVLDYRRPARLALKELGNPALQSVLLRRLETHWVVSDAQGRAGNLLERFQTAHTELTEDGDPVTSRD
ncbi:MAG: substrate-binding periplasmic protein [Pseudomonadota bacterium]